MDELVIVSEEGRVVADRVETARTFWKKLVGLMFRREFPRGCALVLEPCSAVHTFFVRFPIRALYLGEDGAVLRDVTLRPWRFGPAVKGVRKVVELPVDTALPGRKILFEEEM